MSPSSAEPTLVAFNVGSPLHHFVGHHKLGLVTGADGGFVHFPDRRTVVAPDVGFIRRERVPRDFDYQHYFPVPPDLALEVISPSASYGDVMEKVDLYVEAGVPLIWVAIPQRRVVVVCRPGQATKTLTENHDLDGEDVVPGFRMPIRAVFANPPAE